MSDNLLLTSLWLVPLIGLLAVLVVPKAAEQYVKWVALGFTSLTFILTLVVLAHFLRDGLKDKSLAERVANNRLVNDGSGEIVQVDESGGEADLVVRRAWIPYFNIQYYLGVDGISLSLVVLTGLVAVLACLASWPIEKQVKGYYSLYLLLCTSMIGVFISLDLFLFYVFFEVMLLPMYFLIAIWGGPRREYAAIKFLLYTLFGSVFILVAILILYFWQSSVSVPDSRAIRSTSSSCRPSPVRPAITRGRSSGGCSSCFSSVSSSNCRHFPFTPGFLTPTSRRLRRSA
jgi:NADH-quinone oxidoreductase subunit M